MKKSAMTKVLSMLLAVMITVLSGCGSNTGEWADLRSA